MPVGELFLSAFLQVLFDRLASRELLQFLRQEGLYTKIKKWEETLEMIQELLTDAEEKQLTKPAVKTWLDNLQDLAYDVEDILDEFATEAFARKFKMEQQQQEASAGWKLVPACFFNWSLGAIKFRFRMSSKVKHVTARFDQLCELRNKLGLQVITGGSSSSAAPQRPSTTTSQPIEPAVYGRGADTEKILEKVRNTDVNFLIIPIVGMGGVGKTTLAREIFNHQTVEAFEVKAWVCVSDGDFDVTRISKSILENITGFSSGPNDLATVQNELKKKVNGKKFLLVLDDVWSISYADWEILRSPFKAGALVSRIIVTTRLQQVASTITLEEFQPLGLLSNEDCWSLFSICAFEKNEVILAHHHIKEIREKVVEKCKGLPLAAKTLGGLLRSKQIDEWLNVLNSTLWDLSEDNRSEIPAALKLSYHHLPSRLKRCFAYCSIFPKDYQFKEDELVLLWIAEGLVQQSTSNKRPEALGREYFKDLLSRSIFQQSSGSYNSSEVVMHDLIHDLAEWAFGEINIRLDGVLAVNKQQKELKKVRHFSYTVDKCDGNNKFAVFHGAEDLKARVRTFLPIVSREQYFFGSYLTNLVVADLLPKLKRLRVLSLRSYNIFELPHSIGGLKHLRYLNLSETKIKCLPESTCLLYNLQILLLRDCSRFEKLPSNFKYLIKLHHLDIKGAILIKEMPSGMKDLESLEILTNFIVGKSVGSNLEDLKNLKMLRGELCISGLNNVVECDRTLFILEDKKDLKELQLEWGSQFDASPDEVVEKNVLDMLRPHQHLEKLTIRCYSGTSFSTWVGDPSYINMIELSLQGCEKCTPLPSLGRLLLLKHLTIKGMEMLRDIGSEIYGDEKPFRSLETLRFEDLLEWENWEPNQGDKYADAFSLLRELSIINCPKLSGRLPDRLPSLEKLVIKNCKQLVVSSSSLPKLCSLEMEGCKGCVCNNTPADFKSLKSITLAEISEFRQGLQSFISVTELRIENCSNLVSFPEVCLLSNLSKLEMINCSALISLPNGMNHKNECLGSLRMEDCNSLTFIVRGQLPSSLTRLQITRCEKLEYLWDDEEESSTSTSLLQCLLECLSVQHCPSLKCLSSNGQLPETLQTLSLFRLPELESIGKSFHNNSSLEKIYIQECEKLKSLPKGIHLLSHLQTIQIWDCTSIDCLAEEEAGLPNTNSFHSLNSLETLTLRNCPSLTSFPEEGLPTNLTSLEIDDQVKIYKQLLQWGLHNLTSLKDLLICGRPEEEESFPEQEMEMKLPPSLTSLSISSFPNLKCLMGESFRNLNSLEELTIYDCRHFTSFPEMAALPSTIKSLQIYDCPNFKCFSDLGLPSWLESLQIQNCPNFKCFSDLGLPSWLESLQIQNCPNFKSFSKLGLPSSFKYLDIENCPNFISFPEQGLPSSLSRLGISGCPEVRSFPEQGLPSSLLELYISSCPKLKEECKSDKGKEWSRISHIPCVEIDGRSIYDPEVDCRSIYDPLGGMNE